MAGIKSIAVLLLALTVGLYRYLDTQLEKFYIFDTQDLHSLAKRAIAAHGNDTRAVVDYIINDLNGGPLSKHLNVYEEWMFNNHGSAMGAMHIIHASITEYLIIYGTALGTEGHSGRHTADDYFHIIKGTELAARAGAFEPEVYPQGSVHVLRRGEVKQYKMEPESFALEYARGWIPPMLFFGFADTLTSTVDFPTLWTTVRITGREMIRNLLMGKF